jgi:hypothetical protein
VTAQVWGITQTCSLYSRADGGSTVFIDIYTNGIWEGWIAYGHLNNVAVQPGNWIAPNTVLGTTHWWTSAGNCYKVDYPNSVHTHVEMFNKYFAGAGYACYIRYNFAQNLNSSYSLGNVGRTIYHSLRSQC